MSRERTIGDTDQRRLRRSKVFVVVQVQHNGDVQRAHVLDISIGGARLHTATPSTIGSTITLTVAGRTGAADVIWSNQQLCGVQFGQRLPEAYLLSIVNER